MQAKPIIHALTYSDSGGGKTTFLSTFPTPMLVLMTDPYGKDTPYLKRGEPTELATSKSGTPYRWVLGPEGEKLIRVEYYHDPVYGEIVGVQSYGQHGRREARDSSDLPPFAYPRILSRFARFNPERWASVILDSLTFFELSARKHAQYVINPSTSDPRQWFNASTDAVEEFVAVRLGGLPCNVGVAAHVDESKVDLHGAVLRAPDAPGRMRKRLSAAFGELYHNFVGRSEEGETFWALQTRSDDLWACASQIGAPNPCAPDYRALWRSAD